MFLTSQKPSIKDGFWLVELLYGVLYDERPAVQWGVLVGLVSENVFC